MKFMLISDILSVVFKTILPPSTNFPEAYANGNSEEQVIVEFNEINFIYQSFYHLESYIPVFLCPGIYSKLGIVFHILLQGNHPPCVPHLEASAQS